MNQNHHWFSKEGSHYKFLCKAQTTQKFPLIIATKYNIPFLLYNPGMGNHIKGEVYEINEKVLSNLDSLEKHPSFYVREQYDNGMMLNELMQMLEISKPGSM